MSRVHQPLIPQLCSFARGGVGGVLRLDTGIVCSGNSNPVTAMRKARANKSLKQTENNFSFSPRSLHLVFHQDKRGCFLETVRKRAGNSIFLIGSGSATRADHVARWILSWPWESVGNYFLTLKGKHNDILRFQGHILHFFVSRPFLVSPDFYSHFQILFFLTPAASKVDDQMICGLWLLSK